MSRRFRVGRRSSPLADELVDLLVVGLGNPGAEYTGTRHNVGRAVVTELCARYAAPLRKSREHALVAEVRIEDQRVTLATPQTFMNESGRSVGQLARRYGITDLDRLVIVHDEMDLPVGTVRIKQGGGLAGHNGLRSVSDHLRTRDYVRIRIGVGRPPQGQSSADHVLRQPSPEEKAGLAESISKAADAVEGIVSDGIELTMGVYNARG